MSDFVLVIIAELLLIGLALMSLLRPRDLWRLEHFLSVRGGEPTDFYLFMTRLSGVIFLILAIVFPCWPALSGFFDYGTRVHVDVDSPTTPGAYIDGQGTMHRFPEDGAWITDDDTTLDGETTGGIIDIWRSCAPTTDGDAESDGILWRRSDDGRQIWLHADADHADQADQARRCAVGMLPVSISMPSSDSETDIGTWQGFHTDSYSLWKLDAADGATDILLLYAGS